jgi:hypothetical protein
MAVRLSDGGVIGATGGQGRRAEPNKRRKEVGRLEIGGSCGGGERRDRGGGSRELDDARVHVLGRSIFCHICFCQSPYNERTISPNTNWNPVDI